MVITNIISWLKQKGTKKSLSVKYAFMALVKQNEKLKVGATKIQPDGSDKKEIRKRGYH